MSGFRLGVVLRLREMAEESARVQLAHALAAYRDAGTALSRLVDEADGERRHFDDILHRRQARGDLLHAGAEAVAFAERSVAAGEAQLESAARFLFESRAALSEARRRREVVERLRARYVAGVQREENRREEAFLGELATTRYAWRQIDEGPR